MAKLVTIGSKVTLEIEGRKKEYVLVYPEETDPLSGKISIESPIGSCLLGQCENSTVEVKLPDERKVKCKVIKVR